MSKPAPRSSASIRKATAKRSLWIIVRVSFGLTSLTMMLLIGAWWLGLIPDHNDTVLQERKYLAESLAITYSGMLQVEKPEQIRPMLVEIAHRTPELLSLGVRDKEGQLVIEIGEHESQWTNREGQQSTDAQMKVPIALQDAEAGDLELRFKPINSSGILGLLHDNIFRLFMFTSICSLLLNAGYIWRILRSVLMATSSGAIPRRIRSSLNTLAEGVVILDKQQKIVLANDAFARSLGVLSKDVEGGAVSKLPWIKDEKQNDAFLYPWDQSAATGEPTTGIILKLQGKSDRQELLSINSTPITGVDGSYRGTMVTFDNLTEIEEKNENLRKLTDQLQQSQGEILEQNKKLEFLATRDPLTGCFNRRAFYEQMQTHWDAAIRYGNPLCCIMLDIDHFKAVNDTHGHAVGDQVIQHIAKMIETCKRAADISARFGGEEFVVLLPQVGIEEAVAAAERLRKMVEESSCGSVRYTISLGVAEIDLEVAKAGGQDTSTVLNQADEALYAAKRTGRNRVCRRDKMPEGVPDKAHAPAPAKAAETSMEASPSS